MGGFLKGFWLVMANLVVKGEHYEENFLGSNSKNL